MLKLLIADDEKAIRDSISTLIDWNSLEIKLIGTAKNGIDAYNIILDQYPDIILTDIKMPGLTGLELIRKFMKLLLKLNLLFYQAMVNLNLQKKPCNMVFNIIY